MDKNNIIKVEQSPKEYILIPRDNIGLVLVETTASANDDLLVTIHFRHIFEDVPNHLILEDGIAENFMRDYYGGF